MWLSGKRIGEVVTLRKLNVRAYSKNLSIRFKVLKKREHYDNEIVGYDEQGEPVVKKLYRRKDVSATKLITLKNPYIQYVLPYVEALPTRQSFLFPANTATGHIFTKYFWDVLQSLELEQPVYSHLFRHSLAQHMALAKMSSFEMRDWFDWSSVSMADVYVKSAGQSTPNATKRLW